MAPGFESLPGVGDWSPWALAPALESRIFRAGSRYQPIPLRDLPKAERQALPERADLGECAGLLRPVPDPSLAFGLVVKSVDAETFQLIRSLERPAYLPKEALASPHRVAGMVLDGILEVAHEGAFVSGPTAAREVFGAPGRTEPKGVIGALSRRALDHAIRLGVGDSSFLAPILYRYNTIPVSRRWLESMRDVPSMLGLRDGGGLARALSAEWEPLHDEGAAGAWIYWRSRRRGMPSFKLYVSPGPSAIREAFSALVAALTEVGPVDFKVGRDAFGLLRPDKIVAYFQSSSQLHCVAGRVAMALRACPVQGVPFTASLDDGGLLSWGADPRVAESTLVWGASQSWRCWLTQRLAIALATALALEPGSDPWEFVRFRILLDGVVPDAWTPIEAFWEVEG